VITVLGAIDPDSLGPTLMHEHLASDMLLPEVPTGYRRVGPLSAEFVRRFQESGRYFRVPRTPEQQAFWDRPDITADMHEQLGRGWLTNSMFVLDDEATTVAELDRYRARGGGTVVDVTTVGIGRSPERLRRLAERTGVHLVMGTGWYRWPFHPPELSRMSVEQLAGTMVREITEGVGPARIRAGIIGEIPVDAAGLRLTAPLSHVYPDSEIVALRQSTAARITSGRARLEDVYHVDELKVLRAAYLDLLEREGANLRRVVIGHADQVLASDSLARQAFARGVYLQLDYALQTYATGEVWPLEQSMNRIAWAVREGYGPQLLLSLDLCFRQGLAKYGGGGLTTLQDKILPALRARGVSEEAIRQIVVDNPKRVLALAPASPAP